MSPSFWATQVSKYAPCLGAGCATARRGVLNQRGSDPERSVGGKRAKGQVNSASADRHRLARKVGPSICGGSSSLRGAKRSAPTIPAHLAHFGYTACRAEPKPSGTRPAPALRRCPTSDTCTEPLSRKATRYQRAGPARRARRIIHQRVCQRRNRHKPVATQSHAIIAADNDRKGE